MPKKLKEQVEQKPKKKINVIYLRGCLRMINPFLNKAQIFWILKQKLEVTEKKMMTLLRK